MFKLFEIEDLISDKKEDVLLINLLQKNEAISQKTQFFSPPSL